jgi:hypothetical protein
MNAVLMPSETPCSTLEFQPPKIHWLMPLVLREAIKKNPVKLWTLSKVACHPLLPAEVGMLMRKNLRLANIPNN